MTTNKEGPFHDSLLPELIGFCLEGFFLVGVLSYFQQLREHDRRRPGAGLDAAERSELTPAPRAWNSA